MAELKTTKTKESVSKFIAAIADKERQRDCRTLSKLMQEVTGARPAMWGPSIVGFGSYHYKYESGREGDWFLTGFSPRKQNLSIYLMCGVEGSPELLRKLGKHKAGKGCLYLNRLADVDTKVLKQLIKTAVRQLQKKAR